MGKQPSGSGSSDSRRTLLSSAVSATAHPTRELILRELKEGPRSAIELEDVTGESRYNLYHHLSVLEDAHLITASLVDNRKTKRYELSRPSKPEVSLLILDQHDADEMQMLKEVLEHLDSENIPHADEVCRAKLIFYYPWSDID